MLSHQHTEEILSRFKENHNRMKSELQWDCEISFSQITTNILSYRVKYISNSTSEFAKKKWQSHITSSQKPFGPISRQLKKVLVPYAISPVSYQP